MGKGNKKYEKTQFSREKTVIYDEEDQAASDKRLAKEMEIRKKEREKNISLALTKPSDDEEPEETAPPKAPRVYSSEYIDEKS